MSKLTRPRRPVQYRSAAEWPSTPEIDGYRWTIAPEPIGPTEAESRWAAENLNSDFDADEPTPDHVLEQQAEESRAQDLLERGIRLF